MLEGKNAQGQRQCPLAGARDRGVGLRVPPSCGNRASNKAIGGKQPSAAALLIIAGMRGAPGAWDRLPARCESLCRAPRPTEERTSAPGSSRIIVAIPAAITARQRRAGETGRDRRQRSRRRGRLCLHGRLVLAGPPRRGALHRPVRGGQRRRPCRLPAQPCQGRLHRRQLRQQWPGRRLSKAAVFTSGRVPVHRPLLARRRPTPCRGRADGRATPWRCGCGRPPARSGAWP